MTGGVVPISDWQLALSVILVVIAGTVSAVFRLGLLRPLVWGTVRTFVQLTLVGYVLTYVFALNNLYLILALVTLMVYIASRAAVRRTPNVPRYPAGLAFVALLASTYLVGTIVTQLIIAPEPWYSAQIIIPIFGMILGNSMNGIALSLDRLYAEVRGRLGEVETLLSFGATPWEAVRDSVREAIRAGMTPTINSLMVVGLVSLPGMMTGQILAGADPQDAVRYQIVVMLMIAAAAAIGCLILVGLSYRKMFDSDGALRQEAYERG
ncbi:MAG: iron export ABC transporter permease subunit FetB [Bacillota bacterium]|jgi:putative ABC transport system permease protein|uniref:ABC transporter permease n=1 Tax=Desulforudis sp. DRI-14 TaxID=3459793 RepID=UPI00348D15CB